MMSLDINAADKPDHLNKESTIPTLKEEPITQFVDNMVANLECLGKEEDPNIFLLLGFCRLHKVSHSEFEYSHCQGAVTRVLTQIMQLKNDQIPN